MAVLKRSEATLPVLPKRTVDVPELGGEVVVRGLLLRDRLAMIGEAGKDLEFARVSQVLAATVIDAAGEPLFTGQQWEEFGAQHFKAAVALFNVALEISGFNVEVAQKNSGSTRRAGSLSSSPERSGAPSKSLKVV